MKRKTYWVASCLAYLLSTGCVSIVGTWHRDTMKLSQDNFPIDVVTFNEAGSFTATGQDQNNEHTWTGIYQWDNRVLTLMPLHLETKSFSARLSPKDKLVMSDTSSSDSKEVSFHKVAGL